MINGKMWEKTEVSTRNCYNAMVGKGETSRPVLPSHYAPRSRISGGIVSCRLGEEMTDSTNSKLEEKRVVLRGVLFASCKNCLHFDNKWD